MINIWAKNRDRINQSIDGIFISIWQLVEELLVTTGSIVLFFIDGMRLVFTKPYRFGEITKHMEFIGNKSLMIIALTGAFTGMAMSYQIYLGFNLVNATNLVGPTVALGITKELGLDFDDIMTK